MCDSVIERVIRSDGCVPLGLHLGRQDALTVYICIGVGNLISAGAGHGFQSLCGFIIVVFISPVFCHTLLKTSVFFICVFINNLRANGDFRDPAELVQNLDHIFKSGVAGKDVLPYSSDAPVCLRGDGAELVLPDHAGFIGNDL